MHVCYNMLWMHLSKHVLKATSFRGAAADCQLYQRFVGT
jgi:hypothetical protein